MKTIVLLLLGLAAFASAATYHGYMVVSVIPRSEAEREVVQEAVAKLELEQLTRPRALGVAIDVLVPPTLSYVFLSGLRTHHIHATVKITDVQAIIDEQAASRPHTQTLPRAFDHTKYHDLQEIYSILDGVEAEYDSVSTYTAGTTYEGRPIRVAKVSVDGNDIKEVIWIDCGIHAREWVSPATCMYILDQLSSGYGSDSEITALLDTYDFHVMTSVNPDGYAFTWSADRIWRKNRYPFNLCHGVDPNRNFDSDFGGPGTSSNPCSSIYHGPSAFSEFETQAIRDTIQGMNGRVKMFFTLHSYSQLWMTPYGYTHNLPANYDEQYRVAGIGVNALEAVHSTNYQYGNIADIIYMAAGGSTDWAYDNGRINYAFALELRDTGNFGFLLPANQILPTGEETWAGIVAAVNAV